MNRVCSSISAFLKSINLLILLYNMVLVLPYIDLNQPWVYMCYHPEPPSHLAPPPIPLGHPSAPALASCIMHWTWLVIHFTCDNLHVSMPFSRIIPPLPSPTESKRLFNTSVSLLLSRIEGYRYHLSKFHIYASVYCIGGILKKIGNK